MLYQKSKKEVLEEELFQNPTSEYRAAPFWAWNCKLDKDKLTEEIPQMKKMGMGGFHIHCRVGLDTEYLGEEFFECVHACEEKGREEDMLCYLYDEDRWPSGSAGGIVTKEKKYRTRFMVMSPADYVESEEEAFMSAAKAVRSKDRKLLGTYRVMLNDEGYMTGYERVADDAKEEGLWRAFLEISGDTPWFNDQAYVNTLDKKALDEFSRVTHEKYYAELEEEFGKSIPSIFTDEPQTTLKGVLFSPFDKEQVITAYTDDFDETFTKAFGFSILERLPELFWEAEGGKVSQARYFYHRHVCQRFSEAFGDNVGDWCREHGIELTGHMMNEWTLHSQTMALGEVMRPLKSFGIPGVDMLCDRRELSTAKQAQSVAHQYGREGVMSEIYGVTGWGFDFRNHKLAGDWQAALGVTLRVPHLTWVSMEGEAKRDYPASIGYQSPWFEEYASVEDHFARLNTALTRGEASVKVGVLHPVESYWLYWGNKVQTATKRQGLEENFEHIIEWLLFNLIDFDFISEALLEEDYVETAGPVLRMGAMSYDVVVVPGCRTLRSSTLSKLRSFRERGGEVIFMGEAPGYLDAAESSEPKIFAQSCTWIDFNKASLLERLEKYREVDMECTPVEGDDPTRMKHKENGSRTSNMFYQMRNDGDTKWLFICHVNKPKNEFVTFTEKLRIRIKGEYKPVVYDTMTGDIYPVDACYENGNTVLTDYEAVHDSLLLHLLPVKKTDGYGAEKRRMAQGNNAEMTKRKGPVLPGNIHYFQEPCTYGLSEENVVLLDMAEYAFDEGEWKPREEILRIDNLFREKLGLPQRMEALSQPWVHAEEEKPEHMLKLRFRISSGTRADRIRLAMENPEQAEIFWNGAEIDGQIEGWYVDKAIKVLPLKELCTGENLLEIWIPFGRKTNVEWCYLLGDFGVRVYGSHAEITEKPKRLYYGDYVNQGFPFYAGNMEYGIREDMDEGILYLEIPQYRGALVQVFLDGRKIGNVFTAPYRICCGKVAAGSHEITLKVFGNRVNAFGAVHHADHTESWYGPNLWRTTGNRWAYEYQLETMGILTAPYYWIEGCPSTAGGQK